MIAYVFQKYTENSPFKLFIILQQFAIFLKNSLLFSQFLLSLLFIIIGSITWKTRTAMNAKISMFVVCFEAITYLLLYNLHDCTFEKRFGIWLLLTLYFLCLDFLSKFSWIRAFFIFFIELRCCDDNF